MCPLLWGISTTTDMRAHLHSWIAHLLLLSLTLSHITTAVITLICDPPFFANIDLTPVVDIMTDVWLVNKQKDKYTRVTGSKISCLGSWIWKSNFDREEKVSPCELSSTLISDSCVSSLCFSLLSVKACLSSSQKLRRHRIYTHTKKYCFNWHGCQLF